jgi:hypothetical protein
MLFCTLLFTFLDYHVVSNMWLLQKFVVVEDVWLRACGTDKLAAEGVSWSLSECYA